MAQAQFFFKLTTVSLNEMYHFPQIILVFVELEQQKFDNTFLTVLHDARM